MADKKIIGYLDEGGMYNSEAYMYRKENETYEEYLTRMKKIGELARADLNDEQRKMVDELLASA